MNLGIVTTCKGRVHHLRRSLVTWANLPVTIVAYGDPEVTGSRWRAGCGVVAAPEPTKRFNLARARNIGLAASTSKYIVFADADHMLSKRFMKLVEPHLRPDRFILATDKPANTSGFLVAASSTIRKVGGYDEGYIGFGGEDLDMLMRLSGLAIPVVLPHGIVKAIPHSNKVRSKYIGGDHEAARELSRSRLLEKHGVRTIEDVYERSLRRSVPALVPQSLRG